MFDHEIQLLLSTAFAAEELLPELVLVYGSRQAGRDVDIFMVYDQPDPVCGRLGVFDFLSLSSRETERLCRLWDPIVTEPLLTGKVLLQGEKGPAEWRALLARAVSSEMVVHLLCEAARCANFAANHLEAGQVRAATSNLAYAVTYRAYAQRYESGATGPITLRELRSHDESVAEAIDIRDQMRTGAGALTRDEVQCWLRRIHASLTKV
jgi:hypothetical protein